MAGEEIILQQISDLDFSRDFKAVCLEMGFDTLQDILVEERNNLVKRKGFNYRWFAELVDFLSARQLLHLLQPLPGSNVY